MQLYNIMVTQQKRQQNETMIGMSQTNLDLCITLPVEFLNLIGQTMLTDLNNSSTNCSCSCNGYTHFI